MCKSQAVSIKTLENQIGQIANALLNRPQGTLSSDTEANPGKREVKEHVKAVTLRSGKVTSDQNSEKAENEIFLDSQQKVERARALGSAPALDTLLEDEEKVEKASLGGNEAEKA